jgi:cytochrome b561
MASTERARYHGVAIALHWLIGLALIAQIVGGALLDTLPPGSTQMFEAYQLHKSNGIIILLLSLLRLAWRLSHRAPPMPAHMPSWERRAAGITHGLLYALMLGIPLMGWAMVSVSPWNIPTVLYGVLPWPHLPLGGPNASLEGVFKGAHEALAISAALLIALHIAAALRHHFWLKDQILARMIPWLGR